jgi:ABC-type transport system involved in multi-copper enzyme maturation permease subunit
MVTHLLSLENTKLTRRAMLWIEVGLLALLTVGMVLLIYAAYSGPMQADPAAKQEQDMVAGYITWPDALLQTLSLAGSSGLGGLMLIVLVGAVAAQEYTWRTLHVLISRGVPRTTLLAAKFLVLLVPVALFVVVPLLVGAPLTALFTLQIRGGIDLAQIDFGQLALAGLRTMYTLLPYAALTFMLAIVTRSTVAAIGGGLAYALLLEGLVMQILSLVGGVFGEIWKYLPAGLSASVLSLNHVTVQSGVTVNGERAALQIVDPNLAAAGIALYVLVFFGIALWAFRRQDLTA